MLNSKILQPASLLYVRGVCSGCSKSREKNQKNQKTEPSVEGTDVKTPTCAGVQARAASVEEAATLPRRRVPSESQEQKADDDPSTDAPLRSPIRCVSPEFVSAIAMNPGGRPKEVEKRRHVVPTCIHFFFLPPLDTVVYLCSVMPLFLPLQRHMHSYREAFEEMDGSAASPTPTVGGEAFPQTPAFPISPQTPYFNLCKFSAWLTEGFVELRLSVNSKRQKKKSTVYQILTKYCISLLLI